MTFGFIGNILGDIATVLGHKQKQGAFCPNECPLLDAGIVLPHLIHANTRDESPYVINMLIDLVIDLIKQNLDSTKKAKKRHFSIKRIVESNKTALARVSKKIGNNSSNNETDSNDLKTIMKQLDLLKKTQKENSEVLAELRDNTPPSISKSEMSTIVREALRKQNNELSGEFQTLKSQVKNLIEEVKFDPDNPKPTELRTEENSKQILELTQKVVPQITKSNELISEVETILVSLKKRVG